MVDASEMKSYTLAPPLKIEIEGSNIVVSDGVISLKYPPPLRIISVSKHLVEFAVSSKRQPVEKVDVPEKIGDYVHAFTRKAKIPSGGIRGVYEYYRDEKNGAYLVQVWRGHKRKKFVLGSLRDSDSLLRKTLEALPPKGKQFSKKDLYHTDTLPAPMKHGQLLKAILDVLVAERFVRPVPTINGLKELYVRTGKVAEESAKTKLDSTLA